MRGLLFVLALGLVAAVAVWAYRVNYRTLAALDRVETLRADIAAEHEAIDILRVEWAYLNAPARLSRLAAVHLPQLGLVPLSPEHFADSAMVAYPVPPPLVATAPPMGAAQRRADALEAAAMTAMAAMTPIAVPEDVVIAPPEAPLSLASALPIPMPMPRPARMAVPQ
ncbi:MAG: hypothetical protein ACJAVR_003241 [Paracoccaceae bacterium]|jgi:hypothetical protein